MTLILFCIYQCSLCCIHMSKWRESIVSSRSYQKGVWRCLSFDELADKSHAFLVSYRLIIIAEFGDLQASFYNGVMENIFMLSQNVIWKSFAWVYDKIVKIDFAQDTVNSSLVNKSNSLIRWQNIKVGHHYLLLILVGEVL